MAGSCREKGRLHIDRAGSLKKGAGIKLPQGVAEAAPFLHIENHSLGEWFERRLMSIMKE